MTYLPKETYKSLACDRLASHSNLEKLSDERMIRETILDTKDLFAKFECLAILFRYMRVELSET